MKKKIFMRDKRKRSRKEIYNQNLQQGSAKRELQKRSTTTAKESYNRDLQEKGRDLQKRPTKETYRRDLQKRSTKETYKRHLQNRVRDLQRRSTKETYKETYRKICTRDTQKRPPKEIYKRDLHKEPANETYKRDLQKRPTHEICTRDTQKDLLAYLCHFDVEFRVSLLIYKGLFWHICHTAATWMLYLIPTQHTSSAFLIGLGGRSLSCVSFDL